MEWETAGVIAEVVAAITVVASLWYLAIQIRQNTELARAELEVNLGIAWAELHDNMILNADLAEAYDNAASDWDKLSEEQVRSFIWFVAKSFHILQGMFRQQRRGLLANEVWTPYEEYMVGILQIDAVMGWWNSDGALISEEFREQVETLLARADKPRWRGVSTAEMINAGQQVASEQNKKEAVNHSPS
jgi:hypothetical protein